MDIKKYKKVIAVDIDDTICTVAPDLDYAKAQPIKERIRTVNKLYDMGCYIYYYTSRGTLTGIDWREVTLQQLQSWGCKFHELIMKKPYYDYILDNKAVSVEDMDNLTHQVKET